MNYKPNKLAEWWTKGTQITARKIHMIVCRATSILSVQFLMQILESGKNMSLHNIFDDKNKTNQNRSFQIVRRKSIEMLLSFIYSLPHIATKLRITYYNIEAHSCTLCQGNLANSAKIPNKISFVPGFVVIHFGLADNKQPAQENRDLYPLQSDKLQYVVH